MTTTELSAETRAHILDAAWERVREHGPASISVRAIANDAGVSRQLVYFHYGNRAGLLNALASHLEEESGLPQDAPLEELMRAWCALLPDLLPVARAAVSIRQPLSAWSGSGAGVTGSGVEHRRVRRGWSCPVFDDT